MLSATTKALEGLLPAEALDEISKHAVEIEDLICKHLGHVRKRHRHSDGSYFWACRYCTEDMERPKAGGATRIDIAGKVYGALKVLAPGRKQRAGWAWVCYCLTCGVLQQRLGTHLRGGHRDGCMSCEATTAPRSKRDRATAPPDAVVARFREKLGAA